MLLFNPLIQVAVSLKADPRLEGYESLTSWTVDIAFAILAGFAMIMGMAWWRLRKGASSARGWGIAASILNLSLFPLGTIAGIAGLIAFSQKHAAAGAALPTKQRRAPIACDGTNQYTAAIFLVLQIAFVIAGVNWWHNWARKNGLV